MFSLLLLLLINNPQIKCQIQQLYENFNQLKKEYWNNFNDWKCGNNQTPQVYKCSSGMDLIIIDNACQEITYEIVNILPHFKVQLYIDVYGYRTLDGEKLQIYIDQEKIWEDCFRPSNQKTLGLSQQCKERDFYNYQIRKTVYYEMNHNSETLKIKLNSNVDQEFSDESYLFRNLQIFYYQCYKTCKTCVREQYNECSSCYNNISPISNTCQSCKDQINQTFLQIPKGCVVQCPDQYDYDSDKVCYKNQKLKYYDDLKLTKSQEGYQISGQLDTSTILLRITITIELMDNNFASVLINREQIAQISRYIIKSEPGSKSSYLKILNNEIMIEINKPISEASFTIDIVKYQHLPTIPKIKVQYLVCALNCQECQNSISCKVCVQNYYLYNGQCLLHCPDQFLIINLTCVTQNEIEIENQEVYLVKEFYDLSTSKQRIAELFTLVVNRNSQLNFNKGSDIYFSYFQDRRIFGGPFVWVNAQFKFHLGLENKQQRVYVNFEIILGDTQQNKIQFHYTINSCSQKTLTITNNQNLKEDQNWTDDYQTQIILVRETIDYQISDNKELNILFDCYNIENNILAFCGIKNLFISVQQPIQDIEIDLLEQYQNDNKDIQDQDELFVISICGDGIISANEDCDDGNLVPFDGCFSCQHSCEQFCQFCVKGECLFMLEFEKSQKLANFFIISDLTFEQEKDQFINCEIFITGVCLLCKNGYFLNKINNQCETNCGDQIIQGQEQCDDGNLDNYDGCSNCQLIQYENCDMQTCALCYQGKCIQCNSGFMLDIDKCTLICGDGLVNQQEEECDNPNELGCINCQIQEGYVCNGPSYSICKTCGIDCLNCQKINEFDIICHDCMPGYYPVLNQCLPCDENCITCKDQSNLCTSFYVNDCDQCGSIFDYETDYQNIVCIIQCSKGVFVQEQENFNDGNLENEEGCDSKCRIRLSENSINKLKHWQFNQDGSYNLNLNYSEYQLILNCQNPNIIIDGMQTKDFSYNISAFNNTCNIQFSFFKSIFKYNIIHVTLTVLFQGNRLLQENNIYELKFDIQPQEYAIITDSQKKQVQQIQNAQSTFNFIFLILIPASIILNLYDYLWAVLDILSWINNFYFLNVNYPFNVEAFLLNQNWSSFVTFPTYQGLNQPDCSYYFQAPQKFSNKGIDPLFFNNIQVPCIFIFIIFFFYGVAFFLLHFFKILEQYQNIKQKKMNHRHFSIFNLQVIKKTQHSIVQQQQKEKKTKNNTFLMQILNIFILIEKKLKNKLKQTLSLCLLDITLAIMLQIKFSEKNSNFIVDLNQFFAIISITIILFELYQQQKTLNIHPLLAQNTQFKESYEVYYEKINTKASFGFYFKFFGLFKKILYIFFMVYYYQRPIFQTLLCFVSASIGVMFILYQNPYDSKKEFYSQFIQEFSLSIILLITVLFSINDSYEIMFIKENNVNLGWALISFVILAIFVQLFGLTYEIMINFYQLILKIKNYNQNLNKDKIEQDVKIYDIDLSQAQTNVKQTNRRLTKEQKGIKNNNLFNIIDL